MPNKLMSSAAKTEMCEMSARMLQIIQEEYKFPPGVQVSLPGRGESVMDAPEGSIAVYYCHFYMGLRLPIPSAIIDFCEYTNIPLAQFHPNAFRVLLALSYLVKERVVHQKEDLHPTQVLKVYKLTTTSAGAWVSLAARAGDKSPVHRPESFQGWRNQFFFLSGPGCFDGPATRMPGAWLAKLPSNKSAPHFPEDSDLLRRINRVTKSFHNEKLEHILKRHHKDWDRYSEGEWYDHALEKMKTTFPQDEFIAGLEKLSAMRASCGKKKQAAETSTAVNPRKRRRVSAAQVAPSALEEVAETPPTSRGETPVGDSDTATPAASGAGGEDDDDEVDVEGVDQVQGSEVQRSAAQILEAERHDSDDQLQQEGEEESPQVSAPEGRRDESPEQVLDFAPGEPGHVCHYPEIPSHLQDADFVSAPCLFNVNLGVQLAETHYPSNPVPSGQGLCNIAFQKMGEGVQFFQWSAEKIRDELHERIDQAERNSTRLRGERDIHQRNSQEADERVRALELQVRDLQNQLLTKDKDAAEAQRILKRDLEDTNALGLLNAEGGFETFRILAERHAPGLQWDSVAFDAEVYKGVVRSLIRRPRE